MTFAEFAPIVQGIVQAEFPSVPKASIRSQPPRCEEIYLEWLGRKLAVRLTNVDDNNAILHVVLTGVSIMPVIYPMTEQAAREIAISLAAIFKGSTPH